MWDAVCCFQGSEDGSGGGGAQTASAAADSDSPDLDDWEEATDYILVLPGSKRVSAAAGEPVLHAAPVVRVTPVVLAAPVVLVAPVVCIAPAAQTAVVLPSMEKVSIFTVVRLWTWDRRG